MKWKWPLNNIFHFIYFHFISYPSGSTRLLIFIPQNSHYSSNVVDDVVIMFFFHEMSCSFRQTFVEESPPSFSLSRCQKKKKRNHPCFSLMQPHTIFNMKMQCSVFLPLVLWTRCQFQRLKYSVCPSVYTDDLIFTRKNRFIIATCCLYCRTNRLRWLVSLSINTAIHKFNPRILLYQASYLQIVHGFFPT